MNAKDKTALVERVRGITEDHITYLHGECASLLVTKEHLQDLLALCDLAERDNLKTTMNTNQTSNKAPVEIAKTELIHGLETWLPEDGSTVILCKNQTGPYVKLEDYKKREEELYDLVSDECLDKNQAEHQLAWLRRNCKIIFFPGDNAYPIEHAPHAGKDQWDNLMEQAGDCASIADSKRE